MKNILKNLRDDETIHIMEPDKGNGIVIVNRNEYIEKVEKILSDPSKFEKLLSDPLKESLRHEKHLRNFLLYLKKQNIIDDSFLYERLAPTGSKPGILYGLPKVHKANLSFRPILSAIGTHSYNISKYLLSLLNPLLTNRYLLSDTLNVPLNETIVITINRAYNNSTLFYGFPLLDLKKLLNTAVKDSHFILNNNIINRGKGFQWDHPSGFSLLIFFLIFTNTLGYLIIPKNLNLFFIAAISMIAFFSVRAPHSFLS